MSKIVALAHKLAANPVVAKTFHTAWQAGLGAAVASLSGTHGDVRVALMVGVAAAAAAVKNTVLHAAPAQPVVSQPAPAAVEPPATAS